MPYAPYSPYTVKPLSIWYFIRRGYGYYLKPFKIAQIDILLTVILLIALDIAFILFLKKLIDVVLIPRNPELLYRGLIFLLVYFTVSTLLSGWQSYAYSHLYDRLLKHIKVIFFDHVQRLPMSYLEKMQPGEGTSLFSKELNRVVSAYSELTLYGANQLFSLLAIMATLFILEWKIGLLVLVMLPFLFHLPNRFLKKATAAGVDYDEEKAEADFAMQDNLASQPLLRAFGLNQQVAEEFFQHKLHIEKRPRPFGSLKDIRKVASEFKFFLTMVAVSAKIELFFINAMVIGAGAYLTFRGELSIGTLSGVMLLTPKVTETMVKCCYFFRDLVQAATALQRLEHLFDAAEPAAEAFLTSDLEEVDEVKLDDVSFSYDPSLKLLDKFNLSIRKKQSLAILGRSGTGKSTLFKLMMGFYGPAKGEVRINDAGIRHYRHDTLGKVCGVVFQDERNLINGTVRDNIALANPDATDAEIEAAAKKANIHDFILTLPNAYQSPVGEHGRLLSGGQRKQVALARAILHKPDLLLLDDVTAELDPDAEEAINLAIRALSEHCAVIYTTHRLNSALYADHIAVLDQGRISEYGTHHELLEQKGLYYRFWQLQNGFSVSRDGRYAHVEAERLKLIPLFKRLDDNALRLLAQKFSSEYVDAGQIVYAQGTPGLKFYLIVRGTAQVSALSAKRREVRLAVLQDGDYFGEVEVFNGGARNTTVASRTPLLCLTLDVSVFREVMQEFSVLQEVMRQMALGRGLTTISCIGRRSRNNKLLKLI